MVRLYAEPKRPGLPFRLLGDVRDPDEAGGCPARVRRKGGSLFAVLAGILREAGKPLTFPEVWRRFCLVEPGRNPVHVRSYLVYLVRHRTRHGRFVAYHEAGGLTRYGQG